MPSLTANDVDATIGRRVGGAATVLGATPLPADLRSQIGTTLAELATGDPDSSVRKAAWRLRQGLASLDPANTPLGQKSISLIAGCGRELILRSTSDIDVEITLQVEAAHFDRAYGIRAGSARRSQRRGTWCFHRALLLRASAGAKWRGLTSETDPAAQARCGGREVTRFVSSVR